MIQDDDLAFVVKLLAGQTQEDSRVWPIPSQRLGMLARRPSAMTGGEMAALLVSPRARAAFAAARRAPSEPADDHYVLRPASFAAADGEADQVVLEAPFGTLDVRPGPDADVPHLLVLRLNPAVPGGVASRRAIVWETRSGQVWIDGLTDTSGVLHAPWPLDAARPRERPRDRLRDDTLRFALGEEPVS